MSKHTPIPKDWPVQPLRKGQNAKDRATCGTCGLSWDDGKVTSMTPAPSARCPFESFHAEPEETEINHQTWQAHRLSPSYKLKPLPVPEAYVTCGPATWPGNRVVAVVHHVDGESAHDLARLISAAPDLLEALRAMVDADDAHWPLATAQTVRENARAAIAKAGGAS